MLRKISMLLVAGLAVSACSATSRLSQVGQTPPMTPIENPAQLAGAGPAQLPMPHYPPQSVQPNSANSLWTANSRTFFGDPRANEIGDILTINIDITDSAQLQNTTSRSRTTAEDSDLSAFFGWQMSDFFNDAIDPTNVTSLGSTSSLDGAGSVNRNETISMTVAAIITQVLPNGNLVLAGRQEVRVNNEIRELLITGIARPEDIASDNTISHTQIAEARISYGGRGHISEYQRPRVGTEIYDLLMPF